MNLLLLVFAAFAPPAAQAGQPVVFQAIDFPGCPPGPWKPESGGSAIANPLGFTDCARSSGFRGTGTPRDPYRVALDDERESIEIRGLNLTTRSGYTVQIWFRPNQKRGRMMLVDSWKAAFDTPLRLTITDGKPACSIEMPFPDRIYLASSSTPISLAQWHHAACRFRAESRELALFLNGHIDGTTRVPPGSISSNRVRIGDHFAGDIAEVVFSGKAEDEEVIRTRCQQESRRFAGAACGK
jgi:hypothetical protein